MKSYLRDDLKNLKPYKAGKKDFRIKLDANESPYDLPDKIRIKLAAELLEGSNLNRYPDSDADSLRRAIARYYRVKPSEVMVGTGSDELIRLITTAFLEKGDSVLCPVPSFEMYRILTCIAGGIPVEVPLGANFEYDTQAYFDAIKRYRPKIVFICTPNNPTGTTLNRDDIIRLIEEFDGIVVIDEAYSEFCKKSVADCVVHYPNAIVLRTFSKAMGLAGCRVGYLICNEDLASQIYTVKSPYNVSSFSQRAAQLILENIEMLQERISSIISERDRMIAELKKIENLRVYPSEANFILVRVPDDRGSEVFELLKKDGILVRSFPHNPLLKDCLRITVGSSEENTAFLDVFKCIISKVG